MIRRALFHHVAEIGRLAVPTVVALASLAIVPAALAATPPMQIISRADGVDGRLAVGWMEPMDVSADGRYVLFGSDDPGLAPTPGVSLGGNMYLRDTAEGRTELISRDQAGQAISCRQLDGHPLGGVSADAKTVTYACHDDSYVLDRVSGVRRKISFAGDIDTFTYRVMRPSSDGQYALLFHRGQLNAGIARVDLQTFAYEDVDRTSDGTLMYGSLGIGPPALSRSGRYAAFTAGTHFIDPQPPADRISQPYSAWRRDVTTDQTVLQSIFPGGGVGGIASDVADDGTVAFWGCDPDDPVFDPDFGCGRPAHAWIREGVQTEQLDRVSGQDGATANGPTNDWTVLSGDGRYAAFTSQATNLDGCAMSSSKLRVFVRDRVTQQTRLLTRNGDAESNSHILATPVLSADGHAAAFVTAATNLDPPRPVGSSAQIYEAVDIPTLFSQPERKCASPGGGGSSVPTCVASVTLSTNRDTPLDLPPAPCSDPAGRPLTINVSIGPAHGSLTGPFADGHRLYTPAAGFTGSDAIYYSASNGIATSPLAQVVINVLDPSRTGTGTGTGGTDTTAPEVTVKRPRLDRRRRVRLAAGCDEPCTLSLRSVAMLRSGRKLAGPRRTTAIAPGVPHRLRLALALHVRHVPLSRIRSITLAGGARDAAGNRTGIHRAVPLRKG